MSRFTDFSPFPFRVKVWLDVVSVCVCFSSWCWVNRGRPPLLQVQNVNFNSISGPSERFRLWWRQKHFKYWEMVTWPTVTISENLNTFKCTLRSLNSNCKGGWLGAPWIVSCHPDIVCRRTQVTGTKRTWRTSQLDRIQPAGEDGSQKPDGNIRSWRRTRENMRGDTGETLEEERRHGVTNRRQLQRSVCSQRNGTRMSLTSEAPRTVKLQEDVHNHQKRLFFFFFFKSVRQLLEEQLCVADMMAAAPAQARHCGRAEPGGNSWTTRRFPRPGPPTPPRWQNQLWAKAAVSTTTWWMKSRQGAQLGGFYALWSWPETEVLGCGINDLEIFGLFC